MPKIIFKIDINHDTKNWERVNNMVNLPYGLTRIKNTRKKIKEYSTNELKQLEENKEKLLIYFNKNINIIFSLIEQLTERSIYTKNFYASFTTAGLMPYDTNDSLFMIPAEKSVKRQLTIIIHELLHLQITHYYLKYCLHKSLDKNNFSELNEIVTSILIIPILDKLKLTKDKIYPKHKTITKKLSKFWEDNKNIKRLINKYLEILETKH